MLTDYKVLILTLSDKDVPPAVQKMIADKESEINTDDASKLIGCINALSKQILGDEGIIKDTDPEPMRRAVAFCQSIAVSKKITATFNTATDSYIRFTASREKRTNGFCCIQNILMELCLLRNVMNYWVGLKQISMKMNVEFLPMFVV